MHAMQYEITLPADDDMGVIRHRVRTRGAAGGREEEQRGGADAHDGGPRTARYEVLYPAEGTAG